MYLLLRVTERKQVSHPLFIYFSTEMSNCSVRSVSASVLHTRQNLEKFSMAA